MLEGHAHENFKEIENVIKYFGLVFSYLTLDINIDGVVDYKIPIKYIRSSKIYSLYNDNKDKFRSMMPIITYDVVSLGYLPQLHNNSLQTQKKFDYEFTNEGEKFYKAPYRISIDLKILCIKLSHLYQILEQILPHFTPSMIRCGVTEFEEFEPHWNKYPITLVGLSLGNNAEEGIPSFVEDLHSASLRFTVDTLLYSRLKNRMSRPKIKEIILKFYTKYDLDKEILLPELEEEGGAV